MRTSIVFERASDAVHATRTWLVPDEQEILEPLPPVAAGTAMLLSTHPGSEIALTLNVDERITAGDRTNCMILRGSVLVWMPGNDEREVWRQTTAGRTMHPHQLVALQRQANPLR